MLIRALNNSLLLLVLDVAVASGHVRREDLGQLVFDAPRRPQRLVVALDGLEGVDLLGHRLHRRVLMLILRDVDNDRLLLVETLPSLRVAQLVVGEVQGLGSVEHARPIEIVPLL